MVPVWNMLSSEAKCLAHLQDYASCECVRPPNPLEQKTAYDVSASARHHGMSCTTREGRPSFQGRPCLSDAWLSCAGSGELAPEVGNSEPVNMNQGRSVPPSIGSAARGTYCGTLRRTGVEIEGNTLRLA